MRDNIEHGWIVNQKEKEETVAFFCDWCGETIMDGDEYYDFCGEKVCAECVRDCKRTADNG